MRGKKTGGRKRGSKNKAMLAMEAAAAAGLGGDDDPRAVPTLTKIMKYFDKAEEEARKQGGGRCQSRLRDAPRGPDHGGVPRPVPGADIPGGGRVERRSYQDKAQDEPNDVASLDDPHAAMRIYRRIVCGGRACPSHRITRTQANNCFDSARESLKILGINQSESV
jgi:hypothetical protein